MMFFFSFLFSRSNMTLRRKVLETRKMQKDYQLFVLLRTFVLMKARLEFLEAFDVSQSFPISYYLLQQAYRAVAVQFRNSKRQEFTDYVRLVIWPLVIKAFNE